MLFLLKHVDKSLLLESCVTYDEVSRALSKTPVESSLQLASETGFLSNMAATSQSMCLVPTLALLVVVKKDDSLMYVYIFSAITR